MTYSCTDFVDSILDALGIQVPEADADNPAAQADLALAAIKKLKGSGRGKPTHNELVAALGTLLAEYSDIDAMLESFMNSAEPTKDERKRQSRSNRQSQRIAKIYRRAIG